MTTTVPPTSSTRPPVAQIGAIAWLHKNLFGSWFNSLLTVVILAVLVRSGIGFIHWAVTAAKWQIIPANLSLFLVGRYPAAQYWRLWTLVSLLTTLAGLSWGIIGRNLTRLFTYPVVIGFGVVAIAAVVIIPAPMPYRLLILGIEGLLLGAAWIGRLLGRAIPGLGLWLSLGWAIAFFLGLWLLLGGLLGVQFQSGNQIVKIGIELPAVGPNNWGGLLLTVFMSVVSVILSFPFGVLLAIGRQSSLPVLRWLSTIYIEVVRGLPLISLLFIGSVMVPLFLAPGSPSPDLVTKAIVGLTLFTAAYLAETIRGGLQSIPRGQSEAARALGLNTPLTLFLIVLPQALKISIPAIVGLFISLLQDTTLVSIIGLFDLLGISRSILANPNFVGRYAEAYLFIGVLYWMCCYAMSWGSRRLEQTLNTSR